MIILGELKVSAFNVSTTSIELSPPPRQILNLFHLFRVSVFQTLLYFQQVYSRELEQQAFSQGHLLKSQSKTHLKKTAILVNSFNPLDEKMYVKCPKLN